MLCMLILTARQRTCPHSSLYGSKLHLHAPSMHTKADALSRNGMGLDCTYLHVSQQEDSAPKEDDASKDQPGQERAGPMPVHVLPLYAMLPGGAQDSVFRAVPSGHRLIIVATNVAETSLTIPGAHSVLEPICHQHPCSAGNILCSYWCC